MSTGTNNKVPRCTFMETRGEIRSSGGVSNSYLTSHIHHEFPQHSKRILKKLDIGGGQTLYIWKVPQPWHQNDDMISLCETVLPDPSDNGNMLYICGKNGKYKRKFITQTSFNFDNILIYTLYTNMKWQFEIKNVLEIVSKLWRTLSNPKRYPGVTKIVKNC